VHPLLPQICCNIAREFNVEVKVESRAADVWTWSRLQNSCNFRGCEVLVVDTEGYDAQILRSLIEHCRWYQNDWPRLIQFETMGHCDILEGHGAEWQVIGSLEAEGYRLIGYSYFNSHLAREQDVQQPDAKMLDWLQSWKCDSCSRCWAFPYITENSGVFCRQCRCKWTPPSPSSDEWTWRPDDAGSWSTSQQSGAQW